jgi:hypothetical protein
MQTLTLIPKLDQRIQFHTTVQFQKPVPLTDGSMDTHRAQRYECANGKLSE